MYPPAADVRRYVEPFVGSGAVFFDVRRRLAPSAVVLSDTNAELVNAWIAIRDEVAGVIRHLADHEKRHAKSHYYEVRAKTPRSCAARAARLVYLNRTCFNGLYRVNSKGQFNVPLGRYANPRILDRENLLSVHEALRGVDLGVRHFRETVNRARAGDFVYIDPPYHPLSSTAHFTSYTDASFGEEDQRELGRIFDALTRRGCRVMLSNSDTPLVREIYGEHRRFPVLARRSINSKGDRRGKIRELVVLSYDPPASAVAAVG